MTEVNTLIGTMINQVKAHCLEKTADDFKAKCCECLNFLYTSPSSERIVNIFNKEETFCRVEMQSWLLRDIAAYKKELEVSKPDESIALNNNQTK